MVDTSSVGPVQPLTGVLAPAAASHGLGEACRTVMVIDGAYAHIGARNLPGGRIDYTKFRDAIEHQANCRFRECWFFDQEPVRHKSPHQGLSAQYTALKLAPPLGPQFQLKLYAMKKYSCHCRRCGHTFTQNVQKGVDNGIATKILSLAYENVCDRFVLFAGDGDFYDSLNLIKNVLRKDLWVIGYRDTVSADLQQLASHVIWINDLWSAVQFSSATKPPAVSVPSLPPAPTKPKEPSPSGTQQKRRRKGNGDRQVEVTSVGTAKLKPRNKSARRNGVHDTSPVLQSPKDDHLDGDGGDEPWFFVDNQGSDPGDSWNNSVGGPPQPELSAPDSSRQVWRENDSPKRKRRRREQPKLTFELSDMSSEEDERHPLFAPLEGATTGDSVTIIDLASDSDST